MTAEEIYRQGLERMKSFKLTGVMPALRAANSGAVEDVFNTNGCANYQWIPGVVDLLKPKQILELGGAMGVWDIMVLNSQYSDFKLYSVTLAEHGLEYSYVVDKYPNFVPVVGDDLDLNVWPKELDLSKTDIWYYDSLHTEEQLRKELDLYHKFHKKGALLIFDDIHSFGLEPVWEDIKNGKYGAVESFDATDPLHFTGYGLAVVL